jgi:hypothetical protein
VKLPDDTGFAPMPVRLVGERDRRISRAASALSYHHPFLDDCLRAILPNDLILIGASTGVGKTDLMTMIAAANARAGKRVHYFALEAEEGELEMRTKFAMLSLAAYQHNHPERSALNYTDWLLGRCEHIVEPWNDWADDEMLRELGGMQTYYRGARFNATTLKKHVEAIADSTDLIALDHFHYVDTDGHDNENRAHGELAQLLRDLAIDHGKPVMVVAHLRKRDKKLREVCPDEDEFHGSSNLVKNATQIIALARASSIKPSKWYFAPTFMRVVKDRRAGATPLVGMINFDRRTRRYEDTYTLGMLTKGGSEWEELERGDEPHWAKRHVSTKAPVASANQTEMGD